MSDRHEQAGAHAEARTQTWTDPHSEYADGYVSGHMAGVEWADANPKPHTITREELAEAVGILEGEQEEGALGTDALYQALIHLRIEVVTDDE